MKRPWTERFSVNARDYEGYSIGKLFALLDDPDIISLAGGLPSPDMFLRDELRRAAAIALGEHVDQVMQYSTVVGEKGLLQAVSGFLAECDGVQVSPEEILVTSSGQQGLDLVGRLFLDPGDVVLVDRPTFAGAIVAFQMQRPRFVGVDLEEDGTDVEGFRRQLEGLAARGKMPKFMYVVPDFQNPTGITMSLEKRKALLDLSARFDVPIVEDSPYRHLCYYDAPLPSLYSLDRKEGGERVIGVHTFSKLFCPGLRVGYNVGPGAVVEKMANLKEGNVLNTPKFNQDMCTAFLTQVDWQEYFERCRAYYRDKLEVFLRTMEENFPSSMEVRWTRPRGGLFLWVSVPGHIDTYDLFHEALRFKVAFVPGSAFYGESPSTNHMRINFSYPSKDALQEGVRRLSACLKAKL